MRMSGTILRADTHESTTLLPLHNSDKEAFERTCSWQGGYLKWGRETYEN